MYILVNVARHRNVMGQIASNLVSEYGVPVSIVDDIQKICPKCTKRALEEREKEKIDEVTDLIIDSVINQTAQTSTSKVAPIAPPPVTKPPAVIPPPPPKPIPPKVERKASFLQPPSGSKRPPSVVSIVDKILKKEPSKSPKIAEPVIKKARVELLEQKTAPLVNNTSPKTSNKSLTADEAIAFAVANVFTGNADFDSSMILGQPFSDSNDMFQNVCSAEDFKKAFDFAKPFASISDDGSDQDEDDYAGCMPPQILASIISSTPNMFANSNYDFTSNLSSSSSPTSQTLHVKRDIPPHMSTNGKVRRGRIVYTPTDLDILEQFYNEDPNACADPKKRDVLCNKLSIDYHRLKVWFQNRRRKDKIKLQLGEEPGSSSFGEYPIHLDDNDNSSQNSDDQNMSNDTPDKSVCV